MFDNLGKRQHNQNKLNRHISTAAKDILQGIECFAMKENRTDQQRVEQFCLSLIRFDSAINEQYSRIYHSMTGQNPNIERYYESLVAIDVDQEEIRKIRYMKKVRNRFAHSYDFRNVLIQFIRGGDFSRLLHFRDIVISITRTLQSYTLVHYV